MRERLALLRSADPPPRMRRIRLGYVSEQELRCELDLARRSGVAGREARIADHAERRAADRGRPARLAEVRLVEQVEDLDAELHASRARRLHVLDDRRVGVAESGTGDGGPRQA